MHYRDGTEALVGDIVRGRGYNLPYEIVGPVTELFPSMESCNIRVAVVKATWHPYYSDGDGGTDRAAHFGFEQYTEAGATREFELVHRHGWKQTATQRSVWLPEDVGSIAQDEQGRTVRVVKNA